jgi:hypothetical protein
MNDLTGSMQLGKWSMLDVFIVAIPVLGQSGWLTPYESKTVYFFSVAA